MEKRDQGDPEQADSDLQRALRDTGARHMKGRGGWWIYRVVDSTYITASLHEVRTMWSLNDLVDAWRRIDFYEERDRIQRAREAPSPKPHM